MGGVLKGARNLRSKLNGFNKSQSPVSNQSAKGSSALEESDDDIEFESMNKKSTGDEATKSNERNRISRENDFSITSNRNPVGLSSDLYDFVGLGVSDAPDKESNHSAQESKEESSNRALSSNITPEQRLHSLLQGLQRSVTINEQKTSTGYRYFNSLYT